MILAIEGTFTGRHTPDKQKLDEVKIEAHVYSKQQARAEFERFLNAVELEEMTEREMRLKDQEGYSEGGLLKP